jgi:L-fuculose-phosphate aldolase
MAAAAPVVNAPATNRRRVVSVIEVGAPLSRRSIFSAYDPGAMQLPRLREEVAAACRKLAADGLVHATAGNVSARDGDLIAITPTGARLEDLRADEVAVVDRAGAQVDGPLAPTSELELHLGVVERFGAGAVVHTHAPFATALSCVLDELPLVHYEMLMLGGPVRVAPYATFGTPELAAGVLDALDGRTAALMGNHGAVSWGADLAGALAATEVLEWACAVYWRACQVGEPRVMGDAEREAFAAALSQRGYDALGR